MAGATVIFKEVQPDEEPRTTRAGLLRKIARGSVNRLENRTAIHEETEHRSMRKPSTDSMDLGSQHLIRKIVMVEKK